MSSWWHEEEDNLISQVNNGEITEYEYHDTMRRIRDAVDQEAEEAANQAREDYYYNN